MSLGREEGILRGLMLCDIQYLRIFSCWILVQMLPQHLWYPAGFSVAGGFMTICIWGKTPLGKEVCFWHSR